jgi:hypothetical protein
MTTDPGAVPKDARPLPSDPEENDVEEQYDNGKSRCAINSMHQASAVMSVHTERKSIANFASGAEPSSRCARTTVVSAIDV